MSSFYDKYGGNPSYIGIAYDHPDINKIETTVPLDSSGNGSIAKKELPNFKTLFEDYKLHNPEEHRAYLFTLFDTNRSPIVFNTVHENAHNGQIATYYTTTIQPFDEKKIEFQTVVKDNKQYLAPSTEYVNYLKQQDEAFALSIVELTEYRNMVQSTYISLPQYQLQYYTGYPTAVNAYNAKITQVNNQFKSFIADTCRSLVKLNKPFYATVSDVGFDIPVSIGNFNAYELDKFICSVFGDVTADDFIPEVNEEIYNAKTSTGCCLKVCVSKELYRKEGVPYEQSPQKVQDDSEFQKWLQSDEFNPYVPPAPYKEITLDKYMGYLNEAQSFARSPLKYAFEKFKPFLEQGLSNLKNGGHITAYKIQGNNIDIELDLF